MAQTVYSVEYLEAAHGGRVAAGSASGAAVAAVAAAGGSCHDKHCTDRAPGVVQVWQSSLGPAYGLATTALSTPTHLDNGQLHCAQLQCTALYCTVLHCTVLYCTVLHCTVKSK